MLPGLMPPVADARFPIVVAQPGTWVANPAVPFVGRTGFSTNLICSPIIALRLLCRRLSLSDARAQVRCWHRRV